MTALLLALAPIFLTIALGAGLSRHVFTEPQFWAAIEKACFFILFPAILLRTMATADTGTLAFAAIAAAFLCGVAVQVGLLIALRPVLTRGLGLTDPSFTSLFQGALRWHGFIGLAVVTALYGPREIAIVAIAIAVLVPALNIAAIIVLLRYGDVGTDIVRPRIITQIVLNPFIQAIAVGLFLNLTGIGLPEPLFTAVNFLAGGALGLSLLTVGAGLRAPENLSSIGAVVFASGYRLLLNPLIMFVSLTLFGITGVDRTVGVICAAVPTAASSFIMARQMGGDAPLMANIITTQVCVAAVTLPIVIALASL
ncbi:MAG: AEC family transporter [Pseudomonadota bacterium]